MNILIIYYSGTGNTKRVVNHLKDALVVSGNHVEVHDIESGLVDENKVMSSDLTGFAFPIYGFSAPRIMLSYINSMPIVKMKKAFILQTGADFTRINHDASYSAIKRLKKKGYNVYYDRIIAMPSNWMVAYDFGLVKQLDKSSKDKTIHMAKGLNEGLYRRYKTNIFSRVFSRAMSYGEHYIGAKIFGFSLRVNNNCIHCNKCIENCPNGNIVSKNASIHIKMNCNWCMRCIYNCPQKAIYSKGMSFCIIKDGYNLKEILDSNSENYVDKNTSGYYQHFLAYLNDESM